MPSLELFRSKLPINKEGNNTGTLLYFRAGS
jgi:hypothetical protein